MASCAVHELIKPNFATEMPLTGTTTLNDTLYRSDGQEPLMRTAGNLQYVLKIN